MEPTLPAVLGAALVDSVNPCAFALLLLFVATMLAMLQRQATATDAARARRWLLSRGGVYISGIFLTYLALGFGLLGSLRFAKALSGTHLISKAAALVALGLGLMMVQEVLLPELGTRLTAHVDASRLRSLAGRLSVPSLFGAGVLVGLCTVPCSGAVYLAVLALLSAQATALAGAGYLVLYNLVFVTPLGVILALASSPPGLPQDGALAAAPPHVAQAGHRRGSDRRGPGYPGGSLVLECSAGRTPAAPGNAA